MMAKFTEKQLPVKINHLGNKDYIYLCVNEREIDEKVESENVENIIHFYVYDYDEIVVLSGEIDYDDLNKNPYKYMYLKKRMEIYANIAKTCEETIYKGVDIELSEGNKHFSLTQKDQLNLFGVSTKLANGETQIEYHSDGEPCEFYGVEDAKKIVDGAMRFVSYHTTYCNSLNMWIKNCPTEKELDNIFYGAEIPEQYQSNVLKTYYTRNKK